MLRFFFWTPCSSILSWDAVQTPLIVLFTNILFIIIIICDKLNISSIFYHFFWKYCHAEITFLQRNIYIHHQIHYFYKNKHIIPESFLRCQQYGCPPKVSLKFHHDCSFILSTVSSKYNHKIHRYFSTVRQSLCQLIIAPMTHPLSLSWKHGWILAWLVSFYCLQVINLSMCEQVCFLLSTYQRDFLLAWLLDYLIDWRITWLKVLLSYCLIYITIVC